MDQLTFQNLVWFIVLMASVIINWRLGYRRGVIDAYTQTTIPVVELLVEQGHIKDTRDDVQMLTAKLVRLAMLRREAGQQDSSKR